MSLLKNLGTYSREHEPFLEYPYPLVGDFIEIDLAPWRVPADRLAIVKSPICPGQLGHVIFQGVQWRACCDRRYALLSGAQVNVLGRRSNILVVEPTTEDALQAPPAGCDGTVNAVVMVS